MLEATTLTGLFAAAFLAATPVPFQSEIVFLAMQAAGVADLWVLILVASIGNTLGSFVNYGLGRSLARYEDKRWFPATPAKMARAEAWFQRWGAWVLLLSWAPLGDLITVMAGVLRTPLWRFALLVAIAKTGRYIVLGYAAAQVIG